jgi:hypothetical protein
MAISRRSFIGSSVGSGAVAIGAMGTIGASGARAMQPGGAAGQGPAGAASPWSSYTLDATAREVVGVSHANLDRLRELVSARPGLANSTVDLGFGDWETAIGAASHVGRPDIVEFLVSNGARPDVFTFAMLGNLDAVRAMIEATPGLQKLGGPHGLTLMHHARAGGDRAAAVVEYLGTLEGADDVAVNLEVEQPALITGIYGFTGGATGVFMIAEGRRAFEFQMEGHSTRNLIHTGGLEFHPVGARHVRFRFTPAASVAERTRVAIDLGDRVIEASRKTA